MGKRWRGCSCGPKLTKRYKPLQPNELECKNVDEIITALTIETLLPKLQQQAAGSKRPRPFKTKHFRPMPRPRQPCVPMTPSLFTRLQYIGHCPYYPAGTAAQNAKLRRAFEKCEFGSSSDEEEIGRGIMRKKRKLPYKKKVRYHDLMPGDVMLPTPIPVIKHTDSDKSIVKVASPKTSGEVIQVQRASVKPTKLKPPLPPKSGYELFKPHSGIVLNETADYAPNIHIPNVSGMGGTEEKPGKHRCTLKTCTNKKCRRYRAMLAKRKAKNKKSKLGRKGASDGKPRARGVFKQAQDDDDACGLDEIPNPQHVYLPMNLKRGTIQTHSLTVIPCTKSKKADEHYGILQGTFNMYDGKFSPRSRGRQALTMSVMAYCLAFHYHPKQWTMKLIDNLLEAGDIWYLQCLEKVHDHSSVQGICEVLPFGKKQTLDLNEKRMQVLLGEPDIVGYTMSTDPMVYNMCRGLKAFFAENRAGVMMSRVLKVVIWKDRVCYYIFDPAGRDSRGYSNFDSGRAALMNVKDLDSVAEFLLKRSILEDQKFVLAPVKVLKMVDVKADIDFESDKELTQAEKAMMGYRILNENCAVVNANMHLGDRCFEDAKFRQAIPIAVMAMTYAKISPPNTWFSKTLNKILRLGNKLYVQCTHPKTMIDLTIDNIPNEITVGPYACEIIIYRERIKGQLFSPKDCFLNIRTGLQEFFNQKYNSGILEFNNYALAIWKQKEMFYLFDPYPRTTDGLRTIATGKACCIMGLNPETLANVISQNFDYLPATTQFCIHAFKVLKLKKRHQKAQITCTLSDDELKSKKSKRQVLPESLAHGDGTEKTIAIFKDALPADAGPRSKDVREDEEKMGDIVSLVDSIQEDYLPPIPLKYKDQVETIEPKMANLDSPTISVTQVVPPWPKPRDKTNEPPEPDPDPEPTPPPTPPPVLPPEGGVEEEEAVEEEEDEETMKAKKEEAERKKAEEEEARRKAEELPPPLPPPPPSPQPEPEVPLRQALPTEAAEEELEQAPPLNVDRRILLTDDAQKRFKLRQMRKKMTAPLIEEQYEQPYEKALAEPHNFKDLPDKSQIIRGDVVLSPAGNDKALDILPFGAIMAIVTSYKYAIDTWSPGIVNFVVNTAKLLFDAKKQKFQLAPVHIIPKIAIGHQAFNANVDVVGEGASWELEEILDRKFFTRYDRGMVTTATYSCAIFKKNDLYYLFDGSPCNAMGLRDEKKGSKGTPCFLRFRTLRDLAARIGYNKNGKSEDQQFILSRILVRRLLDEPRLKLPEDYDYDAGKPKSAKSKMTVVSVDKGKSEKGKSAIPDETAPIPVQVGYQRIADGLYKIEGTTALTDKKASQGINACHFVSLMAMLMATMHPIPTWNAVMVDTCIEKGLEIMKKAKKLDTCEKRVIKNVILDGKFINVNIKKILVVNENRDKSLEQYLKAVMRRLRYVIIRFPECSMVICQTAGYYHLFDPYPPPPIDKKKDSKKSDDEKPVTLNPVASWTLYKSMDALIKGIRKIAASKSVDHPEFYTFELTSVKTAPRHSALNYRLSPLFKPDENPNAPYLKRRKIRPIVDEKMYWLNIPSVPWSRMSYTNDLGFERGTPKTLWKNWDIEFPGDLYSLWGSIHPMDEMFDPANRGKQYLATSVLALGMTQACDLSAWTSSFLDGIVIGGDKYHQLYVNKHGQTRNHEVEIEKLDTGFDDMYPFSFSFKFETSIFGFVYNILEDRFNLSKALAYFFEKHRLGILTSTVKNLAFGKYGSSYFMFDCQTHGAPIFSPGTGASYILKCESLNRLIYCMTITLNVRSHGQQFDLYGVAVTCNEQGKKK